MMPTALLLALLWSPARAEPAERVFVFVLDGLRVDEGVEAEDTYLPSLWNTYRPQGTLVRGLINRDSTITEPAHRMALSGRRQPLSNFPWYDGRLLQRSLYPTLFEELRQTTGDTSMVIGNTVFMESQGWSLYPGLGAAVGGAEPTTDDVARASDARVMSLVAEDAAGSDRRLFVVNLHQPDKDGHAHKWDDYIGGMELADGLIDDFVEENVTSADAVVVFADHGRHTGEDWAGHGDACSGCRESFLLAWGAGVAVDVDIDGYEMTDVAPTLAALLGVDMPLARGRVIREVLDEAPDTVADEDALVDPVLAAGDGVVHQVAQRVPSNGESGHLVYRRFDGETWSAWSSFGTRAGLLTPEVPRVWADGDTVLRAWRAYQTAGLHWGLFAQQSSDGGDTWDEVEALQDRAMYCAEPALSRVDDAWIGLWSSQSIGDTDRIAAWMAVDWEDDLVIESHEAGELHMAVQPTLASFGADVVAVVAAVDHADYETANEFRQLYALRGLAKGTLEVVVAAETDGVSLFPTLIADGDVLRLAWAERGAGARGQWSLRVSSSEDGGASWTEPEEIALSGEAWRPAWVPAGDALGLAGVVIDEEGHHVEVRWKRDGGWGSPRRLGSTTGRIEQISAVAAGDGALVSWGVVLSSSSRTLETVEVTVPEVEDSGTDTEPGTSDTGPEESGETADTAGDQPPCGCVSGAAGWSWLGVLGFLLLRRRR